MANALLDFLQGASNSAAANVSAPVDGIAWLLRKAGINVDRPVMGSDWMRERGLTAEPTNKLAGILGESVGGVLPMVTAAKAPQIAQGLLQAERNLAAPRTLNPQTGAILWHGSPHKFDAFDSSKIGTGEGAQAYGHGLYLADAPDVAKTYMQTSETGKAALANQLAIETKKAARYSNEGAQEVFEMFNKGYTPQAIRANIDNITADGGVHPSYAKKMNQAYAKGMDIYQQNSAGALYKVDLPDEHIAKMLDWDKPLSEQQHVIDALKNTDILKKTAKEGGWYGDWLKNANGSALIRNGGSKESDALRQAGIPGIRYLDGGSRGTGAGTSNYVVFPGNEGLLSILERNGQPLK